MKKNGFWLSMIPIYALILGLYLLTSIGGSKVITVLSEQAPILNRKCVIIDAGHGGLDGGAVSCSGVYESSINLQIALRLEAFLHLLGIDTVMIRNGDYSVYTQGETIAAKKISDLKRRVEIINGTENGFLVSIHQNHFSDSKYSGAQVFYGEHPEGQEVAAKLQANFVKTINIGSKRQCKKAQGVYLMQKIQTPGILVECGFLSNLEEEAKLRSAGYQMKIVAIIGCVVSSHIHNANI